MQLQRVLVIGIDAKFNDSMERPRGQAGKCENTNRVGLEGSDKTRVSILSSLILTYKHRRLLSIHTTCCSSISYTNEEALLPFFGLNPRPLQDGIRTGNTDPLRRRRALQMQHARLTELLPRGLECIANSKENTATHEEWGFAYSLLAHVSNL